MKMIQAYEFKDLSKEAQEKVREKVLNDEVNFQLDALSNQLEEGLITEEEYYQIMGCSKSYAESTAWFIPSCYYDKHKKEVDEQVNKYLKEALFNSWGTVIV